MSKNELFFKSSDGNTNIHMITWEPDGEVLGVFQMNHGVCEHIGRYEEFAKFLNTKGILVVGIDLIGHGMSTNNNSKKMYLGKEGSFKYLIDDIHYALTQIKNIYPNIPYVMSGISFGSFLTKSYMIDYPGVVDGAILFGTGFISKLKYKLARIVINSETKKYGDDKATEKIRHISFNSYNKKFKPNRTEQDWLCKSEAAIDAYLADELRGHNLTIGLFRELLNTMLYCCDVSNINKMNKMKPIYLLSGSDDCVGGRGNGVSKVMHLFNDSGIEDVEMKLYPTLRHAILHEDEREEVFNDVYEWLVRKKLVNESTIVKVPDNSKKKEYEGLVDYDEYDIVWPEVMEEHLISRKK